MRRMAKRASSRPRSKHRRGRPLSAGSAAARPFGPVRLAPEQLRALGDWARARGLSEGRRPSRAMALRDLCALAAALVDARLGATLPGAWWRERISRESLRDSIDLEAGLAALARVLIEER